jgi:hypothetical protein
VAAKKRGVHERIGSDLSETFRILLGDGQPTQSRADGASFNPEPAFRPTRARAASPPAKIVNAGFRGAAAGRFRPRRGTSMHEHRIRHVPLDLIDDEQPHRLGPRI